MKIPDEVKMMSWPACSVSLILRSLLIPARFSHTSTYKRAAEELQEVINLWYQKHREEFQLTPERFNDEN